MSGFLAPLHELSWWDLVAGADYLRDPSLRDWWVVLFLSTALDVWVARRILFRGGTVGLGRALLAAVVLTALYLPKVVLFRWMEWQTLGTLCFPWFDAVVLLPLVGLEVLWRRRRGTVAVTASVRWLARASLLMPLVGLWATAIEPHRLVVEEVTLPGTPVPGRAPLRVAVLSDVQVERIGPYERRLVQTVLDLHPDVILMPGDLHHGDDASFARCRDGLRELLARLDAPGGVFFVPGDVDEPGKTQELLAGTHVRLLLDEVARTEVAGRVVLVGGFSTWEDHRPRRAVLRALADAGPADLRLLLSHRPDDVAKLPADAPVDLVVSGHTHGGQVVVPGFGPPITLSPLPRRVGAGGLHEVDGHRVYVSRGAGLERWMAPRIRLSCPPEVTLLLFP